MAKKIYTKTGDKGMTTLFGGDRVQKSDPLIQAQGDIDELSSHIGLITAALPSAVLDDVQTKLFYIGALVSTPKNYKGQLPAIKEEDVKQLEEMIDGMQSHLPELKNFILPGGDEKIARIHVARTVCRRAERSCVAAEVDPRILEYINRLSDYLFVMARYVGFRNGIAEKVLKG